MEEVGDVFGKDASYRGYGVDGARGNSGDVGDPLVPW